MGVSTDAQLCYGILIGEETELPWEYGEEEEWWMRDVCGFKPLRELFDEDGEWIGGAMPAQDIVDRYDEEHSDFRKEHPFPVALVNYCMAEYPMWILAVPRSVQKAHRGLPKVVMPEDLKVHQEDGFALLKFCEQHIIEWERGPCWWLSSYWG